MTFTGTELNALAGEHIADEDLEPEDLLAAMSGNNLLAYNKANDIDPLAANRYKGKLWNEDGKAVYSYCFAEDEDARVKKVTQQAIQLLQQRMKSAGKPECIEFRNVGFKSSGTCKEGPSVIFRQTTFGG